VLTRSGSGARDVAARVSRIPSGHPEGYLEGFANIYSEAAQAIIARREGRSIPEGVHFPTIEDGVNGMIFIDACVRSSQQNSAWVSCRS
jgi:hypothetical protein